MVGKNRCFISHNVGVRIIELIVKWLSLKLMIVVSHLQIRPSKYFILVAMLISSEGPVV